jgi:nucleoside-diphosphate-sugar epimerase
MKVFVSGASGFLGSFVCRYLQSNGHEVIGGVRDTSKRLSYCSNTVHFELRDGIDLDLRGYDAVLHLAHDFKSKTWLPNVLGTVSLARAAQRDGVARQIFVSSYSARKDAPTKYGQCKYLLEQILSLCGVRSVRPGLIIGPGGLFERIMKLVTAFPVIPMIGNGSGAVPLVDVRDVCIYLERMMLDDAPAERPLGIFSNRMSSLRRLVDEIQSALGTKKTIVPIPVFLILPVLYIGEIIGLSLPVGVDNVRAFTHNQSFQPENDILRYLEADRTASDMVSWALKEKHAASTSDS